MTPIIITAAVCGAVGAVAGWELAGWAWDQFTGEGR